MVGQPVCKAHVLHLFDTVFTGYPAFYIDVKVNLPDIFSFKVAYYMLGIEPFAGTFHLGVTLLWPVPAFALESVPYSLFCTFYLPLQYFVTGKAYDKIKVIFICQSIKGRATKPTIQRNVEELSSFLFIHF